MDLSIPLITNDFETYYDDEYSLTHMTTEAYVNDPRFEVIGCSVKFEDDDTLWIPGGPLFKEQYTGWMERHDVGDAALVAHNNYFDAIISKWHFGIEPRLWMDTKSLAYLHTRPYFRRASLSALLEHYELGEKGTYVSAAKGKHLADFTPEEMLEYAQYCINDTDGCYSLARM